jgi:predicted dehydrogenase
MTTENTESRRKFLKVSTAAGAALSVNLQVARTAHAAGSDTLKLALVGCGGRGTGAVGNALTARDDVQVTALADLFPEKTRYTARALKEQFGSRADVQEDMLFEGFEAYLRTLESDVDIVMLATPPGFRPLMYAAAVAAGKHVFMEKPCCVDAPGYRQLLETNQLADEKNLKVVVGLQRRHSQRYNDVVPRLQDGELGKLWMLRCYWNGAHAGGGYPGDPPREQELEWQIRNWNHFCWLSGDHIVEQHVHNIDVCNWVLRDQHPVEANGMGGRQVRLKSNMYDHHFVEFTYEDGTKMYSQARQMRGCWNAVTEYAHGERGMMELGTNGSDGYEQEHADLVSAIKNDTRLNDGWHGANSSMTAVLGRMATHSGQVVKWDEAVASDEKLTPSLTALADQAPITVGPNGLYPVDQPGLYQPY